jgi:chemotaxis signal transduction protein
MRFLVLSLDGDGYAVPLEGLLEITVPRDLLKDGSLTDSFEGKFEYRGKWIPVLNLKKVLKLSGKPGSTLLVMKSGKGDLGLLVDAVMEILDTEARPLPVPRGVMNPSLPYYRGIVRHQDGLIFVLNEDGLLA